MSSESRYSCTYHKTPFSFISKRLSLNTVNRNRNRNRNNPSEFTHLRFEIMLAQAYTRATRTTRTSLHTPSLRPVHTFRRPTISHIHTIARQPNKMGTSPIGMIGGIAKPLIIAELLFAVGTVTLANEDVVAMDWKGVSFFEKTNGGVVLEKFGRKVSAKKEDGKWKFGIE
ncbi:hypothetical protein CC86DRAFT_365218 [Ophiobolus disseminans]|uniref:Uncharacterized protein n=1 Tax=Ophiobolus disseminans TaxID=1469910 RepID=A0A6A7AJY2_9PLEO|nr:hypothetical protein CC86DRAFT_365218 [Ophiobolus disseminans]